MQDAGCRCSVYDTVQGYTILCHVTSRSTTRRANLASDLRPDLLVLSLQAQRVDPTKKSTLGHVALGHVTLKHVTLEH